MTSIQYGQGAQPVRWVPLDHLGRVRRIDAATYTIVDLREHEDSSSRVVQASTAATIVDTTWTLTAAAGPDQAEPRRLALDTLTGVERGRTYLLVEDGNPNEQGVVVASTNPTAMTVELARDLTRSFTIDATMQLVELAGTFPAAVADDENRLLRGGGPFQITWTYSIDGRIVFVPQLLYLTRYGVTPWITGDYALGLFPPLAGRMGGVVTPEAAVSAATDEIVGRLLASGRDPELLRGNFTATLAARHKAVAFMLMWQPAEGDLDKSDRFEANYERHMNDLLVGRMPNRTTRVTHDHNDAAPGAHPLTDGDYFRLA